MDQQAAEGGKEEAAGGCSEQGKRVTGARPPSVRRVQRGRPPTATQPEADLARRSLRRRRQRSTPQRASTSAAAPRSSARHVTGQAAAHIATPGIQPGAESGSGGLGAPVGFLSNRREQARSEGGSPSHAGPDFAQGYVGQATQRRPGHGPERWHHRPRIRLRAALRRDAGGAERRERPRRERTAEAGGTVDFRVLKR